MTSVSIDRRRQILDTALTSFSNAGYHNTSMNDIAEALSMTKPVVYQYFDSKRALYLELLRFVGDDLVNTVTASVAGSSDPHDQAEQGMIAYFTWVANNKEAFALCLKVQPELMLNSLTLSANSKTLRPELLPRLLTQTFLQKTKSLLQSD